jgi:hypothetical protein
MLLKRTPQAQSATVVLQETVQDLETELERIKAKVTSMSAYILLPTTSTLTHTLTHTLT